MLEITSESLLALAFSLFATIVLTWIFYPAWHLVTGSHVQWETEELNESKDASRQSPLLSIVVPAFNEEARIEGMLLATHAFLKSEGGKRALEKLRGCAEPTWEKDGVQWVIVNDGSSDKTSNVVRSTFKRLSSCDHWQLLSLKANSGKGAAVKIGMLNSQGRFRLMVDADGATDFGPAFENLVDCLNENIYAANRGASQDMVAVFGSRAHLSEAATAKRSIVRSVLMHAFHFFVGILVSTRIRDTQCGFKLFTNTSAWKTFSSLHLHRWAFDTEIVFISDRINVTLLEVAVPWQEVDGSKLSSSKFGLAMASMSMLRDMICVRLCYELGFWKVHR